MNKIEEFTYYCSLFNIYKGLLTDKQRNIMERYFYYDFSLSEISEELKISRAAISDAIEHSKENLKNYEEKLHILEKSKKLEEIIKDLDISEEKKQELIEEVYYGI